MFLQVLCGRKVLLEVLSTKNHFFAFLEVWKQKKSDNINFLMTSIKHCLNI